MGWNILERRKNRWSKLATRCYKYHESPSSSGKLGNGHSTIYKSLVSSLILVFSYDKCRFSQAPQACATGIAWFWGSRSFMTMGAWDFAGINLGVDSQFPEGYLHFSADMYSPLTMPQLPNALPVSWPQKHPAEHNRIKIIPLFHTSSDPSLRLKITVIISSLQIWG